MKFLVTNDDGIDAVGLAALVRAVAELGQGVVVAPDRHLSGCGHQTTTDRALHLSANPAGQHALDGTPVDCVRIGLGHVAPDAEWILSGINEGGNLGADLYRSGTVAAVREGALLGKPGIAISQYRRRGSAADWSRAARWTADVVRLLLAERAETGTYWNVNLPDLDADAPDPQIVFCSLDPHPLNLDYRMVEGRYRYATNYHQRPREPGHDIDCCFSGSIAVTQLRIPAVPAAQRGAS